MKIIDGFSINTDLRWHQFYLILGWVNMCASSIGPALRCAAVTYNMHLLHNSIINI